MGLIPHPYPFNINPKEVEKTIEVPLKFFALQISKDDSTPAEFERGIDYPEYRYHGELIWGNHGKYRGQLRWHSYKKIFLTGVSTVNMGTRDLGDAHQYVNNSFNMQELQIKTGRFRGMVKGVRVFRSKSNAVTGR